MTAQREKERRLLTPMSVGTCIHSSWLVLVAQVYGPELLNKLMAESDYIVNALPVTEATLGVIDARAIASMKHNAVFVNVGRGKTIDENALIQGRFSMAYMCTCQYSVALSLLIV